MRILLLEDSDDGRGGCSARISEIVETTFESDLRAYGAF